MVIRSKSGPRVPKDIKKNWVIRGDGDLEQFVDYINRDENPISERLNAKRLLANEENLSYRVISHWETIGLISSDRPSGKGWRKYSSMELLWLKIVKELRLFGMSIEVIKKVRANLSPSEVTPQEFPLLECYVIASLMGNPCQLLVFPNGEAEPVTLGQYETTLQYGHIDNCIVVNLNRLLQSIFPKANLEAKYGLKHKLSDDEVEVILMLRTSDFKEIKIKKTNGEIDLIEATQDLTGTSEKIIDIIRSADYQDIEIVTAAGRVVSLKRTIKKKGVNSKKQIAAKKAA